MISNTLPTIKPNPARKLQAVALIAVALLSTAGCHPKTKATPENFTAALNAYFLEHSDCLFPVAPRFPFETSDPAKTRQFDSLIKAQLLTKTEEISIHASRYTPTTTGARFAPRFCYGHRTIATIDSFTPPAQANGFPETQVNYHYTMQDVPVWAETDEVKVAFPAMAEATSGNATGKATLAGTLAGWQVPD